MDNLTMTVVTASGYEKRDGGDIGGWVTVRIEEGPLEGFFYAAAWDGLNSANVCERMRVATLKQLVGKRWPWKIEPIGGNKVVAHPAYPKVAEGWTDGN